MTIIVVGIVCAVIGMVIDDALSSLILTFPPDYDPTHPKQSDFEPVHPDASSGGIIGFFIGVAIVGVMYIPYVLPSQRLTKLFYTLFTVFTIIFSITVVKMTTNSIRAEAKLLLATLSNTVQPVSNELSNTLGEVIEKFRLVNNVSKAFDTPLNVSDITSLINSFI